VWGLAPDNDDDLLVAMRVHESDSCNRRDDLPVLQDLLPLHDPDTDSPLGLAFCVAMALSVVASLIGVSLFLLWAMGV
jgi:hypothetical protein